MPREFNTLSLSDAQKIVNAVLEHVQAHGLPPMAVVVVDRFGEFVSGSRMNGLHPRYFKAAHRKAYTGAIFERGPLGMNQMWAGQEKQGHQGPSDWNDSMLTTMPGGYCVTYEGEGSAQVVGGIGVAGDEDTDEAAIAAVGVQALGEDFKFR